MHVFIICTNFAKKIAYYVNTKLYKQNIVFLCKASAKVSNIFSSGYIFLLRKRKKKVSKVNVFGVKVNVSIRVFSAITTLYCDYHDKDDYSVNIFTLYKWRFSFPFHFSLLLLLLRKKNSRFFSLPFSTQLISKGLDHTLTHTKNACMYYACPYPSDDWLVYITNIYLSFTLFFLDIFSHYITVYFPMSTLYIYIRYIKIALSVYFLFERLYKQFICYFISQRVKIVVVTSRIARVQFFFATNMDMCLRVLVAFFLQMMSLYARLVFLYGVYFYLLHLIFIYGDIVASNTKQTCLSFHLLKPLSHRPNILSKAFFWRNRNITSYL